MSGSDESDSESSIPRDGHVQPYFDEFVSLSSFHFYPPIFNLKISKILSKNFFGAI